MSRNFVPRGVYSRDHLYDRTDAKMQLHFLHPVSPLSLSPSSKQTVSPSRGQVREAQSLRRQEWALAGTRDAAFTWLATRRYVHAAVRPRVADAPCSVGPLKRVRRWEWNGRRLRIRGVLPSSARCGRESKSVGPVSRVRGARGSTTGRHLAKTW